MGCSSILLGTCHVVASLFVMKEHTSGKDESCSVSQQLTALTPRQADAKHVSYVHTDDASCKHSAMKGQTTQQES